MDLQNTPRFSHKNGAESGKDGWEKVVGEGTLLMPKKRPNLCLKGRVLIRKSDLGEHFRASYKPTALSPGT